MQEVVALGYVALRTTLEALPEPMTLPNPDKPGRALRAAFEASQRVIDQPLDDKTAFCLHNSLLLWVAAWTRTQDFGITASDIDHAVATALMHLSSLYNEEAANALPARRSPRWRRKRGQ